MNIIRQQQQVLDNSLLDEYGFFRKNTLDEMLNVIIAYKNKATIECHKRVDGTGWFRETDGGGKMEWDFSRYFYRLAGVSNN
jgi:hypothetical protein